jgi:hypothetical protein
MAWDGTSVALLGVVAALFWLLHLVLTAWVRAWLADLLGWASRQHGDRAATASVTSLTVGSGAACHLGGAPHDGWEAAVGAVRHIDAA